MNKTDEKYIQLPPLERDLDSKILSVIWEYCLMDKKNQIMIKEAMSKSSSALISKVGGFCLPAADVTFGVESYEDISDYAKGEIDGTELAYNLGENAAGVAGGFVGAQWQAQLLEQCLEVLLVV